VRSGAAALAMSTDLPLHNKRFAWQTSQAIEGLDLRISGVIQSSAARIWAIAYARSTVRGDDVSR
jgi:hypothetical protein